MHILWNVYTWNLDIIQESEFSLIGAASISP